MVVPQGRFALQRVPPRPRQPLRAWDAADELVLDHLAADTPAPGSSIALVGDRFGALACALSPHSPVVINESAAGREAIAANLARNGLARQGVWSILDPPPARPFDRVVVRIPKSLSELEDTLQRVGPALSSETLVTGLGMVKHIQSSTIELFERMLGPTTTSLATKKARLIHCVPGSPGHDEASTPAWPRTWRAHGLELVNHGGGFSPSSLDAGTGFLLDHLKTFIHLLPDGGRAVDLGCGNGIIGLRVGHQRPDAEIVAIDDSLLALDAAKQSWERNPTDATVTFHHHHRMAEVVDRHSVDLVVVNPPFHDDRVVGDQTAWDMFVDSHRVLAPGGSLVVIGNRHLAYHAKLGKIFGNSETLAANKRFVLLHAIR